MGESTGYDKSSLPRKSLKFYAKVLLTFYKQRRCGPISDPIYDIGLRWNEDYRNISALAAEMPVRKLLIAAVDVPARRAGLDKVFSDLSKTKHEVSFLRAPMGDRGKFDNISLAIKDTPVEDFDWFIVVDDDIEVPQDFLDRFLYLSERAQLVLSQPAHRIYSHKIWGVTRRTWRNLVRRTHFVECGPLTAFHRSLLPDVLPFPPSRFGWCLDFLWAEAARRRGLHIGIVDATPIRHTRPVAGSYNWGMAEREKDKLLESAGIDLSKGGFMVNAAEFRTLDQI